MKRFLRILFFIFLSLIPRTLKPKIDAHPRMSTWKIVQMLSQVSDDTTAIPVRNSYETAAVITLRGSGNYQLVENIVQPIFIADDKICLDLNGYEVSAVGSAITVAANQVYLHNGRVTGSTNGVLVNAGKYGIRLEQLEVSRCGTGVKLDGLKNAEVAECELVSLDLVSNSTAIELVHANQNIIERCHAVGSSRAGFSLSCSSYNRVLGCHATKTHNTDTEGDAQGFVTESGKGNIFDNCTVENSLKGSSGDLGTVAAGFRLTGTEHDTKVINCLANRTTNLASPESYGFFITAHENRLNPAGTSGNRDKRVTGVSWTSDGKYLAVTHGDSWVNIYEYDSVAETLIHQHTIEFLQDYATAVAWRPGVYLGGPYYLAIGANSSQKSISIYSYSPSNGSVLINALDFFPPVLGIDWGSNGAYLAVTNADALMIYNWDLRGSPDIYYGNGACESVAFSQDGRWITIGDIDSGGSLLAFNYTGPPSGATLTPAMNLWPLLQDNGTINGVLCLDASADSRYLAVGLKVSGTKNALQIFDYNGGSWQRAAYSTDHNANINSVSWGPQTAEPYSIVTGGDAWENPIYRIRKFSFDGSTLPQMDKQAHSATLNTVDWSAQGNFVASGGASDGNISLRVFKAISTPSPEFCLLKNNMATNCGYGFAGEFKHNRAVQNIAYNNKVPYSGIPNVSTYNPNTPTAQTNTMDNTELL